MDVDSLTEDDAMNVDGVLSHSDDMAMVDDPLDCNYFPEGKKNEKLQKVIQFLKGHSQWSTHTFTVSDESAGKVPCFVGGNIPRPDSGDRGEYCLAMLTLFRPWQSGLDLKLEGESWEDAFHSYKFTQRQQDIMKFFNIRYECNVARDDFNSQRQQGKFSKVPNEHSFVPYMFEGDQQNDHDRVIQ